VKLTTYAIALLAVLAVAIAGCGGGGSTTSDSSSGDTGSSESAGGYGGYGNDEKASEGSDEASSGGSAVVSLGNSEDLGMILVDAEGMTVYNFHKDKGSTSSCYDACAEVWPPVLTEGEPEVGNGASASMLGTTERKDGTTQVTYAGQPLYTFVEDQKPGEAKGNDLSFFGGEWYALQGSGEDAEE
jgi:predicted lipoprotein with Yx(FWY)xxD motif